MDKEWNPIETAPKDGRELLLYCPISPLFGGGGYRAVAHFKEGEWMNRLCHGEICAEEGCTVDTPSHWALLLTPPMKAVRVMKAEVVAEG